ncbi:hypothetical protein B0I35DRAFT_455322 [Stachybotrys elegans]|uniref:gamma-glutamylcyclotransferase n=1 Tax=Stachybotrys elegans TaxID=80388 RepID=A0A8K0SGQ2_9HYPO|nr:hypothetical protein B0I35DRAFT_455322 [Stachybotrys elegans]
MPPPMHVWYLAYGSNLSAAKFIHDRGITPISTAVVTVPGWTLVMDTAGVPYSEPAFASITPAAEKSVQLVGIAYQLTPDMYRKVLASEGGGVAYAEIEVWAERITAGDKFPVRTLRTVLRREARPSARYMNLVRTGASESLPASYQAFLAKLPQYQPPDAPFPKLGATLFLAFWGPAMGAMEKITKANLKQHPGEVDLWVVGLARAMVVVMWMYHDYIHAPIWGRGDGMD